MREQLAGETDPKALKRLTVAREYLDGLSPAVIETKYGWHEQTVYGWLNRFEERGFDRLKKRLSEKMIRIQKKEPEPALSVSS